MKKPTFDPLTRSQAVDTAIQAYLAVLILRLQEAEKLAVDASSAMRAGKRNLTIGTILPLECMLPECEALVRASLILHRMAPESAEGGAP